MAKQTFEMQREGVQQFNHGLVTDALRFYERFGLVPKLIEMMGTVPPRAVN